MTHDELWSIVKKLPSDFEPYGKRPDSERGADCSCGCGHFLPVASDLGRDWGVCCNPSSPRCSLLTFEHMGCKQFDLENYEWPSDMLEGNVKPFPEDVADRIKTLIDCAKVNPEEPIDGDVEL